MRANRTDHYDTLCARPLSVWRSPSWFVPDFVTQIGVSIRQHPMGSPTCPGGSDHVPTRPRPHPVGPRLRGEIWTGQGIFAHHLVKIGALAADRPATESNANGRARRGALRPQPPTISHRSSYFVPKNASAGGEGLFVRRAQGSSCSAPLHRPFRLPRASHSRLGRGRGVPGGPVERAVVRSEVHRVVAGPVVRSCGVRWPACEVSVSGTLVRRGGGCSPGPVRRS